MTICYPTSFWAVVAISVLTAALSFVLTFAHLLALAVDLVALWGLRGLCHVEARERTHPWLTWVSVRLRRNHH